MLPIDKNAETRAEALESYSRVSCVARQRVSVPGRPALSYHNGPQDPVFGLRQSSLPIHLLRMEPSGTD
jgi:hypothetical protein